MPNQQEDYHVLKNVVILSTL